MTRSPANSIQSLNALRQETQLCTSTPPCVEKLDLGPVTSMVLAFLLIYFGVRTYRDNVAGGTAGFGRALAVGALIAVVASVCYVATWQVIYYKLAPDYAEKYQAHILAEARADGQTEEAIARKKAEMDEFAEFYDKPVINAAITFIEPLPVAMVVALVSAGVLSRKRKPPL